MWKHIKNVIIIIWFPNMIVIVYPFMFPYKAAGFFQMKLLILSG